jgi:hypothetical protein
MKPKQIIILSVIFGALLFGIVLKSWVRAAADRAGSRPDDRAVLAEFDPGKLERILIERGNPPYTLELAKENGVWKVKSLWHAKADPEKLEKFIQTFRSLKGELRGSEKKLWPDFGIQDTEAFSIKFFGTGDALLQDLRLGTRQAGNSGFFLRRADRDEVYLADMNIEELLGIYADLKDNSPTALFWADLGLFDLDPEKVTKITLYDLNGAEKIRMLGLERVADPQDPLKFSWKFLREDMSSPIDPDKVVKFIAAMNSIRAEKVLDPQGDGYGLEKPAWQLIVTVDGKKMILNAGARNEKEETIYVKRSGDSSVFGLKTSFWGDLNVDDTHFFKDAAPVTEAPKDPATDLPASMPEDLVETP